MPTRRLVPWLLTLGLAFIAFACVWQVLEEDGRQAGRFYVKPAGVPEEPRETLVARIRASWGPGDRLRVAIGAVGLALCLAGAWRAWRTEGLPSRTLRRVGLSLGIVGIACLALGFFRAKTHPRDWGTWVYVSAADGGIGGGHAHGHVEPAGMLPLFAVGGAFAALAVLIAIAARFHPDRVRPGRGERAANVAAVR